LDGCLSHSFEGSSQNAMLWKLKAIGWVACAGGWLLVVAGVGLGLGPIVLQTYLEMEDAKVGPADSSVERKSHFPAPAVAKLSSLRFRWQMFVLTNGESNLLKGPVALTPPPSRAFIGNSIIAAHRDLQFRFLKDIRVGDEFGLQSEDGDYIYRVTKTYIVEISDRTLLMPSKDRVLTLVTCYPFYYVGSAPQRFIVRANLVEDGKRQLITYQQ